MCAESMQRQGRWRKSVRAVIAVNSMRPGSKDASAAAAANAVQEEDSEPPPGERSKQSSEAKHTESQAMARKGALCCSECKYDV